MFASFSLNLLFTSEPTKKEEKRIMKTLLRRAWKEALRVEEMNLLVLILFPALMIRLNTPKYVSSSFAL